MEYGNINIGLAIEQRMNELGLNKSKLAKKIGISNQYINRLFAKESIDTDKLITISKALDFDFFSLYQPIGSDTEESANSIIQSGNGSNASIGGDITIENSGKIAILEERIQSLNKLLDEKERTIKILMERK